MGLLTDLLGDGNAVTLTTAQLITGLKTFSPSAASAVGLIVRGLADQTGDLQQWQNSAGVVLARMDKDGILNANYLRGGGASIGLIDYNALRVHSVAAAGVAAVIQGVASQSADLQQWQSSAGVVLANVTSTGLVAASFTAVTGTRTLELGAADSAGAGFRTVRVTN